MGFRWLYFLALVEIVLWLIFCPLATIAVVGLLGALAGSTWWFWRSLNETRYRRMAEGQCAECGYDLRGSKERCSECGAYFGVGWNWREDD
jgi:hypothetical protein